MQFYSDRDDLSANSSNWLEFVQSFQYEHFQFWRRDDRLINQSGLINPSPQALAIMQNSSWPLSASSPYNIVFDLQSPFCDGFQAYWFPSVACFMTLNMSWTMADLELPRRLIQTLTPPQYLAQARMSQLKLLKIGTWHLRDLPNYWGNSLTPLQRQGIPILAPGQVQNVVMNYKSDDLSRYTDLSDGAAQIVVIQTARLGSSSK